MEKIKKGDQVVVIAGKERRRRGETLKRGEVIAIFKSKNKVLVSGLNMVKKHVKPNPQVGERGGIVEREAPIHISNVAIYNPTSGKADKVGFKILEDGRKVRYFKSDNEIIDI